MIVIQLQGGLGNQMFQYAAAKTLANKLDKFLYLDVFALNYDRQRNYNLDCFPNIKEKTILLTEKEWNKLKSIKFYLNKLKGKTGELKVSVYIENSKDFASYNRLDFGADIILLKGYFQSERYFQTNYNDLQMYFDIALPRKYKSIVDNMKEDESVAIHVRRGDYISNPAAKRFYFNCRQDYYLKSLEYITNKISSDLSIYIFSDDISWVKNEFKLLSGKSITYMDSNSDDPAYIDLILMSKCKYQIIANSTYSWWAAWLNNYSSKIICTPAKWFNNHPNNEIIPQSWILI